MQLTLTGHHVDVTEALRNHVTEKFEKLSRHFDQVLDAHVTLTVEKVKMRNKAEATVHISGHQLHAECVQEDMYAAIDSMVNKLDRQVVKQKEKGQDYHRNGNEGSHRNQVLTD